MPAHRTNSRRDIVISLDYSQMIYTSVQDQTPGFNERGEGDSEHGKASLEHLILVRIRWQPSNS
jgi:hypothetical protein